MTTTNRNKSKEDAILSKNGQGAATYTGKQSKVQEMDSRSSFGTENLYNGKSRNHNKKTEKSFLSFCKTIVVLSTKSVGVAVLVALMLSCLSFIITDTLTFGYDLPTLRKIQYVYLDPNREMIYLTAEELREYDGSDLKKPIYLAIKGHIYDVTNGKRFYGKGGSYSFFSGRDASRAYVTGCFHEDFLTSDIRGLNKDELDGIDQWKNFYDRSKKYFLVGYVKNNEIDPNSPIPEDCPTSSRKERRL